jgi:predicted AAA+ superfamily ATPase
MGYTKFMINRKLSPLLTQAFQEFPVITLTGPRQSGKTTLLKHLFPHKPYVSMEDPDTRHRFLDDPKGFLDGYKNGAFFDEFQRTPTLPSYLQSIIDITNKPGQFLLSGSQQLEVIQTVSQSLAGRTAIFKLLPLSVNELADHGITLTDDTAIYKGFYPRLYGSVEIDVTLHHRSYIQTYLERDLHQLIHVKDLSKFQSFLRLCASHVGQIVVANHFSNALGISVNTVQAWLSILQASYVIYILPPFFSNIKKRLIKAPKLYFYDTGVASHLLGLHHEDQVSRDPLRGALFENMVIIDKLKAWIHAGQEPHFYFYRDQQQIEIDLITQTGRELTLSEIKSSVTFNPDFTQSLQKISPLLNSTANYVLYAGTEIFPHKGITVKNWKS